MQISQLHHVHQHPRLFYIYKSDLQLAHAATAYDCKFLETRGKDMNEKKILFGCKYLCMVSKVTIHKQELGLE